MSTDSVSIYAIRRRLGGQEMKDFDDVIDPERLPADEIRDFDSGNTANPPWSARLYVWHGEPRAPSWLGFINDGFRSDPRGAVAVPDVAQSRAVVLVKVFFRVDRIYAIPFGLGGRFQVRRDIIDPRYGLRVALNLVYEGDQGAGELAAAPRIRQVESKTVAVNTMRTIRQTNRRTDFEEFELDPDTDQLSGLTGQPRDPKWARRIRGTDSLRVSRRIDFAQLGPLCRDIARIHEQRDYRRRFEFVDRYQNITDTHQIDGLAYLVRKSLHDDPSGWAFAVPGVQDFDRVGAVRITAPGHDEFDLVDPTTKEIADQIGIDDLADHLPNVRVETIDDQGDIIDRWTLLDCLDGQLIDDGRTFLLEGGSFYEIELDYLNELNRDVDALPDTGTALPPSVRELKNGKLTEIEEGVYNEQAANSSPDHFLLDKATVTIPGKTSPIEVCDVLTTTRQLVHVKRKFSSSALSHLFGQGYVSSELLVDSQQYRAAIRDRIGAAHPAFQNLFPDARIVPVDWEVVYGIVGTWDGAPPSQKLPFFSKINLRHNTRRLRRIGFNVTVARIPVVDPTP
jgi:uncharacterized protein (TIGR04141 family)